MLLCGNARACVGRYKAGQYCFVTFPQLSSVESHPYTISSAPVVDEFAPPNEPGYDLGFHIKALGNHTRALVNLVREHRGKPEQLQVSERLQA